MFKEQLCSLFNCNLFTTGYKNTHFAEPIHNNIQIIMTFPRFRQSSNKIQRRPWCETKIGLKMRSLCRIMFFSVVSMLHITQMFIPKFGMLTAIASKQLDHCLVDHFCLAICLWIKGCAFLQFGVQQFPQTRPKLPNKLGVSIRYNGSG